LLRLASWPVVEGGILPSGRNIQISDGFQIIGGFLFCVQFFPLGWKPRLYVSQDGRRHALFSLVPTANHLKECNSIA
jgi:hypothetical protein